LDHAPAVESDGEMGAGKVGADGVPGSWLDGERHTPQQVATAVAHDEQRDVVFDRVGPGDVVATGIDIAKDHATGLILAPAQRRELDLDRAIDQATALEHAPRKFAFAALLQHIGSRRRCALGNDLPPWLTWAADAAAPSLRRRANRHAIEVV